MKISETILGALLCICAVAGRGEEESYAYVPASPATGLFGTLAALHFPSESEIVLVGGRKAAAPTFRPRARVFTVELTEMGGKRPNRTFTAAGSAPDGARWPDSSGRIRLSGTDGHATARTEGPNPFLLRGKKRQVYADSVLTCGGVIIGSDSTPAAFVNGRAVRGGDTVGNLRVFRVIRSGVVVEGRGAFAVLPIGVTTHVDVAEN